MGAKKVTGPAKPAVKEKKEKGAEHKTEPKAEQNPTVKIPQDLIDEIDSMKTGDESRADVIRRLLVVGKVSEAPADGTVTLRMPATNYRQLLVMQPSTVFTDMLKNAKVS